MKLYLCLFLLVLPFSINALPMYQSAGEKGNVTYSLESSSNERILFSQQYQYTKKAVEGFKLAETKPCKGKTKNELGKNCEEEYQITKPKVQAKEPETPARPVTLPGKPATLPAKPARPAARR